MDFQLTTDLAIAKSIEFNHEELKREIQSSINKFNGLIVTEDTIPAAKADRAKLNKLKAAIEDKRKEIKKEYLMPYNKFEARCKELTALIDEPIKAIDNQVKAFEEEQKEEKRRQIGEYYTMAMGDNESVYPLSLVWDNKWLNATFKIKDVMSAIDEVKNKINRDTEAIKSLKSADEDFILSFYAKTLDLSAAIAEQQRMEQVRSVKEKAERKGKETAEHISFDDRFDVILSTEEMKAIYHLEIRTMKHEYDELIGFLKSKNIEYKEIVEESENDFPD